MTNRITSPVLVGRTEELRQLEAGLERSVVARLPEAKRAELAVLLPDLDPHVTTSPPQDGDQTRLFDAVLDLLVGLPPSSRRGGRYPHAKNSA